MNGKLYRNPHDQMIAGVCGGLGAYLGIDTVLVRLFFVLLTIGGGSGVLIYFLLWILVPYPEQGQAASAETIRAGAEEMAARAGTLGDDVRTSMRNSPQVSLIAGVALVLLGLVFLGQNFQIVWLRWLDAGVLWPLLLIVAGAALIWRHTRGASR
jgi:phage shock protein C